ncbi:TetR/AcrR family transcriptional regulator [Zunongwangia sp. H14]|uniref:TetR/AcrR family transcriptional regulator n=1 Tax=Zunongwangia sp. H14 TaxID=3240792 RepID=UPI00356B52F0
MTRDKKSIETQQLITEQAFNVIYRHGYYRTTPGMIMKETRLSKGAFYHHFKNKSSLTEKMISEILHQRIYQNMIRPLYENEPTIELIEHVFTQRLRQFNEEEKLLGCPLNNLINELGYEDNSLKKALKNIVIEWQNAIVYILQIGIKEDQIRDDIQPESIATFLISSFEGIRGLRKLDKDDVFFKQYEESIKIVLQSIKKHSR